MQYLVEMRLAAYCRPTGGPQDGISFIEKYILPSLEACQKLEDEMKILAGGPATRAIRLVMIVSAESAQEIDELIGSLPIWPQMETTVTPLTSFSGRRPRTSPKAGTSQGQIAERADGRGLNSLAAQQYFFLAKVVVYTTWRLIMAVLSEHPTVKWFRERVEPAAHRAFDES